MVEDPEGYHAELLSDARLHEDQLDSWLIGGAERFRRKDPELCRALLSLAKQDDSRRYLLLLESVLETPQLAGRLLALLRPEGPAAPEGKPSRQTALAGTPAASSVDGGHQ